MPVSPIGSAEAVRRELKRLAVIDDEVPSRCDKLKR